MIVLAFRFVFVDWLLYQPWGGENAEHVEYWSSLEYTESLFSYITSLFRGTWLDCELINLYEERTEGFGKMTNNL
jgi:hypothetical protein